MPKCRCNKWYPFLCFHALPHQAVSTHLAVYPTAWIAVQKTLVCYSESDIQQLSAYKVQICTSSSWDVNSHNKWTFCHETPSHISWTVRRFKLHRKIWKVMATRTMRLELSRYFAFHCPLLCAKVDLNAFFFFMIRYYRRFALWTALLWNWGVHINGTRLYSLPELGNEKCAIYWTMKLQVQQPEKGV